MWIQDISSFDKLSDYLPILNGCLCSELIVLFTVFHSFREIPFLNKWYEKFGYGAVFSNILLSMLLIIFSRFVYPYVFHMANVGSFMMVSLGVLLLHNSLFCGILLVLPNHYHTMMTFIQIYISFIEFHIGHVLFFFLSVLLSAHFATYSLHYNIIFLCFDLYFLPFMMYYKSPL